MSAVNWNLIAEGLKAALLENLQNVIEGAESDLNLYGQQLAEEMVLALQGQDAAAVRELQAQAQALAELNRIRVSASGFQFLHSTVGVIFQAALAVLGGVQLA